MKIAYISNHTIKPLALKEFDSVVYEYNECDEIMLDPSGLIRENVDFIVLSIAENLIKYIKNLPLPTLAIPPKPSYKPLRWLEKDHHCDLEAANTISVQLDYDDRMYFLADFPFSKKDINLIQKEIKVFAKAVKGERKKCLVLDLDNVLWGGVADEGGITLSQEGIGRAYFEFQKMIKKLMESGIILTLCSKNNPDVIQIIDSHTDMILKSNDFAAIKINWNNKADNIIEISNELNLGLDSFVFFDDSQFERDCVRNILPMVSVPDLPDDPAYYCKFLSEFDEFECLQYTDLDKERNKLYVQDRKRKELNKGLDYVDYLKKLEIQVDIKQNNQDIDRISQMTQRTNQFNFRTKRYSQKDILSLISNGAKIFTLEYNDIVGSQGIVGLAIIYNNTLDTFLISCRALQRGVEEVFFQWICDKFPSLFIEVIPTKKNKPAQDFMSNKRSVDWIKINEHK
ncbi:MAG: HAD-IIIC family phosphatase [Crenarchaeota archaeon]|nr:MAG: HAD-IIIC family phosphatase [Thermoproteota archaeon]